MRPVLLFNWKGLQGLLWTTESRKSCLNRNEDAVKPRFFYQWGYRSLEMIYWWLKNAPAAALILGGQAARRGARRRSRPAAAWSAVPLITDTIVCLFPPPSSPLPPGSNYIL